MHGYVKCDINCIKSQGSPLSSKVGLSEHFISLLLFFDTIVSDVAS